jgi:hypothetical protein
VHYGPASYYTLGRVYPRGQLRQPYMPTLVKYIGGTAGPVTPPLPFGPPTAGYLLAVADNQNNTGATATLTGSDSAHTNTIYVCSVTLIFNQYPVDWYAAANRLGDGTVNLPLPYGTYWAFAVGSVNGVGAISKPVYFQVTVSPTAVYTRILQDVTARIQGLNIPGIKPAQVYTGMFPSDRTSVFPCIWVTKEGLREQVIGGTNTRDDFLHPVNVYFVDRNPQTYDQPSPQYDLWRQILRRAFERKRLPNVPEMYDCDVEMNVIVDPKLPHYQYLVSGMVLKFKTREPRSTS